MRPLALALAAILVVPLGLRADGGPETLIRDGESFTYNVRWGLIPYVGRITISAEQLGSGPDAVLKVTTTTSTWGVARTLFTFDARGESLYQASTHRLISSSEWSTYRNKVVKNSTHFDYEKKQATYTDEIHPEKSRVIPMPPGEPSDLILALIETRFWNLKPGESRDSLVIFQDQFYPLTIRPEDDPDYIVSSLGFFKAEVLVPRMEKTPPIGMFRKGSTVRVWIEQDDARHLPVRFEVGFRFGTGTASLIEYTPPK